MKKLLLLLSVSLLFSSCIKVEEIEKEDFIWKNKPQAVNNFSESTDEIKQKLELLNNFLDENNLDGMLFTQVRNVNWITGGLVNTQIVLNKDAGAASLLVMKSGKKYLICNGSESPRMMNEDLMDLGYELREYNWFEANPQKDVRGDIIKAVAGDGTIGSDTPFPGTVPAADEFEPLRYSLLPAEIKRYKWLGREVTEAVADVCEIIEPGMNEYEIEALTAASLKSRGILPTVLLIGVDRRIYNYRHALPSGAVLENYAMINVVAEKWGMPIAVTRFVHFGNPPDELMNKLKKTAVINAKYQRATVPGKDLAELFEEVKKWYADAGFEDEWKKHHQGGAIGYDDREYVIYPEIKQNVMDNQAFAWNPTITGAKVEETIIASKNGFDVITKSKNWPMIIVELDNKKYPQPGILIRDEVTGDIIPQDDIRISE